MTYPWNPDHATFIVTRWRPSQKVVLDEDTHRSKWWCRRSAFACHRRRGQNVRLASQLTGWQIDILTEQEESERRQKEFAERTQLFMETSM